MTIARAPLRDQVHDSVIARIVREELKPGQRLSDSVLAEELGVSRTPVREALVRLEQEGFLETEPGRGFFVKPLSCRDVGEAYPILWTLETMALRESFPPPPETLAELDRLNAEMAAAADPERCIELDLRWHRALLDGCTNERLGGMIADLKTLVRRYEYAYMQTEGLVPVSTRMHAEIRDVCAAGDVERAAELLERNWAFGMERVLEWLRAREDGTEGCGSGTGA